MPWVRFDDGFDDDPDIDEMSTDAIALFVCMTTWASRNLTDGFVPEGRARRLPGGSREALDELLAGDDAAWLVKVPGGFQIRSFLKYNPSSDEVQASRIAAAERKRQQRERQQKQRDMPPESSPESKGDSSTDGDSDRSGEAVGSHAACHAVTSAVTDDDTTDVTPASVTAPPVSRIPYPDIPGNPLPKPGRRGARGGGGKAAAPEWFDEWWCRFKATYPPRGGAAVNWSEGRDKLLALLISTPNLATEVIEGAERFRRWADASGKTRSDFIPMLTTWVNQRRWTEGYELPEIDSVDVHPEPASADPDRRQPQEKVDYRWVTQGDRVIRIDMVTGELFDEGAWYAQRKRTKPDR